MKNKGKFDTRIARITQEFGGASEDIDWLIEEASMVPMLTKELNEERSSLSELRLEVTLLRRRIFELLADLATYRRWLVDHPDLRTSIGDIMDRASLDPREVKRG